MNAMSIKLYFVTNNKGKFLEASSILRRYNIELIQIDTEKLEIQSDDLRKIALRAAEYVFEKIRKPIIVEDAGLFIKALNGFPGPYSSYVFKTIGIHGILKLMNDVDDRRAEFRSVVVLKHPIVGTRIFEGIVNGIISRIPKGSKGFGFDPIFIPNGCTKTFAEMDIEEKNKYSHRARAFRALGEWVQENLKRLLKY